MTEDTKVAPALTAEEWARFLDPSGDWVEYYLDREDEHTTAALALYGQPFGFSDLDPYWLNQIADMDDVSLALNERKFLHDLADRIAALLPPRTENE